MTVESLIIQHIDTWTSAVKTQSISGRGSRKKLDLYGIKKLRELILELAVRGKLVPQDPNDEPASVLLERIAKEKAQLVKENKIKKPKALSPICNDKPFSIPNSWIWSQLGFLTNYGVCDKADPKDVFVSTWVLELEDVEKSTSKLLKKVTFKERAFKSSKNRFLKNDVIYGKLRPYLDKVLVADEDGVCTTEMIPMRGYNEDIVPEFLRLVLKTPYLIQYANSSTHGMNLPRMGTEKARDALIPLVPIEEQHRIVAKVDELMALCDQLEQQTEASIEAHQLLVSTLLNTLTNSADADELMENWVRISDYFDTLFTTEASIDQLKQTILQLAVMGKLVPQDPNDEPASVLLEHIAEEKAQLIKEKKIKKQKALPPIADDEKPFELPNGWEWERIGKFGVVGTGATPSRSNPKYWNMPDYNWVSSGETSELFVGETKEKVSELAIKETNVSIYPVGTLIVAMYGQGKTRGQITELIKPAGTNQACAAIQLIEKSEWHKDFVKLYFQKSYEELRSHASGGAQPNLNVGKVQNTVIAIPPLKEQQRINCKVDCLLILCNQLKQRLKESQITQLYLTDTIVEQAV